MQIYDISREFLSAPIFDGDPAPNLSLIQSMDRGDGYNLSMLSACLHTATHIDAPLHFVDNGASIDEIDLSTFMGECDVIACNGFDDDIVGEDIERLVRLGAKRVLFKTVGRCRLTLSGAFALISAGVKLVGIDDVSIAADDQTAAVHRELALAGVCVLEGLTLSHVQSGRYSLFALPIKIEGTEAAPCRAILMK